MRLKIDSCFHPSAIKTFVRGRRFETVTLHQLLQGIRLSDIEWLQPSKRTKTTREDDLHRRSLLAEVVYYLFDSILTPLLRTTFYVTETQRYRNRVLYFRQDDWLILSKPLLERLKSKLFVPIPRKEALAIMSTRQLGYSHIRLLPKERGVRAIVNLRRRSNKQSVQDAKSTSAKAVAKKQPKKSEAALGTSINQILQAAFHILTYEKSAQASEYASSVLGPNEIFRQLKDFQEKVLGDAHKNGSGSTPLYFIKMDVRTAFDTIEQDKLIEIVQKILSHVGMHSGTCGSWLLSYSIHHIPQGGYFVQRHTQAAVQGDDVKLKFKKRATPDTDVEPFPDLAQELAESLRHVVFTDGVITSHEQRTRVVKLLAQHVYGNLVKIGKEFYRQQIGIPQGSSLSTLLCSFFYADLERANLAFVRQPGNLLLRYTDDFLLITTDRARAERFFRIMAKGHPEYGCFISEEKTLCNFELTASDGSFVPRLRSDQFPWCGYTLNTQTLAVRSDMERYKDVGECHFVL